MTDASQPTSTTNQPQEQSNQPSRKGIRNNPTYALVSLIALFTFVLIAVSIIVWLPGKTDPPAERARVTVQEATIVGPLVQHNIPTATILFLNSGGTSAGTTQIRLVMTVWTSNRFPDWDMPLKLTTDAETIQEIGPGSVLSRTVSLIAPLTDVQGMHLERKEWFIVILGVVSYLDSVDNPHETHLCLIWRDTSTQHLSRCQKWNEAD
jgi:hypothetical protein